MGPAQTLLAEAEKEIEKVEDLNSLEQYRLKYLGKNGLLTQILKSLGGLSPEERPLQGKLVNEAKEKIQALISSKEIIFQDKVFQQQLEKQRLDISLPGRKQASGSFHPITITRMRIENLFKNVGFEILEGPEIETDYYNFTALNIPENHPARAMQDTFYITENLLLRTHTSPVQIRAMETRKPPIALIAPGRAYRCDSDVTHTPMFHQVEGLYISETASMAELRYILQNFLENYFEKKLQIRFRPSYFPFTEPSAEVDITCVVCSGKGCRVCKQTGWLEVLGCGMVHPQVLKNVGIDSEKYQGWAFGVGLERLTMLRYHFDDIRLYFENDCRLLQQF